MQPLKLNVSATYPIGTSMHRLVLTGPGLTEERIPANYGGLHIKLLFKTKTQARLELPEYTHGKLKWPAADKKPVARTYSIAGYDATRKELTVDFVKHSPAGIACDFATHCAVGDEIGFSGPGLKQLIIPGVKNYLLVGDASAVPALSAVLAHIPPSATVHIFIELEELTEIEEIQRAYFSETSASVTFVPQRFSPEETLTPLLENLAIPDESSDWSFTLAGEHQTVVDLRKHLSQKKISKEFIYAVPYWRKDFTEEGYHQMRHDTMDNVL